MRKYVLVHFVSESRIAVDPLELQRRVQTSFPFEILLIKETKSSPSYYEMTLGIFSMNISKHTSKRVLRSAFPEFRNVCISFKRGWKSVLLHFVNANPEQVTIFGATSLAEANFIIQEEETIYKLSKKGAILGKNQNRKGWALLRPSARYFSLRNTLIACLIFNVISYFFRWEFPPLFDKLDNIYHYLQSIYGYMQEFWCEAEPVPSSIPPEQKSESRKMFEGGCIVLVPFVFFLGLSYICK